MILLAIIALVSSICVLGAMVIEMIDFWDARREAKRRESFNRIRMESRAGFLARDMRMGGKL